MSTITIQNLSFTYEGSYDPVFEQVSLQLDTTWKLGLIGRNGRGKTTLLNLLLGKYEYQGNISSPVPFDYFPFPVPERTGSRTAWDILEAAVPDCELWQVCRELDALQMDAALLWQPYETLSFGERTRVMLAVLFSRDNHFLLIDEPTNHLDEPARKLLGQYLRRKKGFILVSHDRRLLDDCTDHILAINRAGITLEKGNFSTWQENKQRQDSFELAQNLRLRKEISRLTSAARQSASWAGSSEKNKIGYASHHDKADSPSRDYVGEQSRRMEQRRKNLERRRQKALEEKSALLKNLETAEPLKLFPEKYHKEVLLEAKDLQISFGPRPLFPPLNFRLKQGERLVLRGSNGSGKSSLLKLFLGDSVPYTGLYSSGSSLKISYLSQDTSFLKGSLADLALARGLNLTLLLALLRKLDLERPQFEKPLEAFSAGQKKKVLIAASLCEQAHLYLWDEPLNYIDLFSRIQLEEVLLSSRPTMVLVEHDRAFTDQVGTSFLDLG